MVCYSAIKKNEALLYARIRVKLKVFGLSHSTSWFWFM